MAALICPRATTACLRSMNTRFALRKASSTPSLSFSTAAARPSRQNNHHHHRSMLQSSRSSSIINQTATWQPQQPTEPVISSRKTFSTTSIRPSSNTTATPRQQENDEVLTWDRFFALRKRRRYINLASSVFTGSAAVITFGPMVAQQDLDSWLAQLSGIDPFFVLGLTTFAVGLGGWLCGPTFGSAVFRMWTARKGWSAALAEKEKSFYARVKRYRADPSSSSVQNPVPDYYGEKVSSVKDYRRWLKDQRAFNLKKDRNLL